MKTFADGGEAPLHEVGANPRFVAGFLMHEIPRFERAELNPTLAGGDLGDAFQEFAYELLKPEYPGLQFFPGKGKDGGIDLIQTGEGSRVVIECKHIDRSLDGLQEAASRWRKVAKNLRANLEESGPNRSQPQYAPWYRTDQPIRKYVFCISSVLKNAQQVDELEKEIAGFFTVLSRARQLLSHLSGIKVAIIDWNGLGGRLQNRPHSLFRWFPFTRPQGLIPLDVAHERGTFRADLSNQKLPYYSRQKYLARYPCRPV